MPVHKCPNGKYRIGSGKCQYDSKAKAEKAYKAYLAKKHSDSKNELTESKIDKLQKSISKDIDELYEMNWFLSSLKEVIKKSEFSERYMKLKEKVGKDLDKIDDMELEDVKKKIVDELQFGYDIKEELDELHEKIKG